MKKSATLVTLFLILFSFNLVMATSGAHCNTTKDCGSGEVCNASVCTTSLNDGDSSNTKIDAAFKCLEEKAGDCSSLDTQELALTILATPDNIFDDCVSELKKRESSNNWGNIRDTALAILALTHAGEDTSGAEEWLLAQNRTPTDLAWYLQEDSNEATECHIGYDGQDYTININEEKKIDANAGPCLTRAQPNFWLQINPSCYDKKINIECDKDFIANLIYKNSNSPAIYVFEGTSSSPAFGSVELMAKSKCFGTTSCDYEATAWATIALAETGHNVEVFTPYIIAMSETNKRYLPKSFIYILTNYEDYATALIEDQKLGNYWEASSTSYNKYYDTALALLALSSSSSEQISNAKDWLFFAQGTNGCWQNSVRETAMVLWVLEGRAGKMAASDSSVTYCSEAGYFCIPSTDCPSSEDVGDNYFCSSLSETCCTNENLKTCAEYSGEECNSTQVCVGNSRKSSDAEICCTGTCGEKPEKNECEANFYTCMDECSDFQEPASSYSCDAGQVCCKQKTASPKGSSWWIWVLLILILIVLGAIGYIYREKLKLYWFQLKARFKKDNKKKGGSNSSGSGSPPGIPPKPGFPPIRRPSPGIPKRMTAPPQTRTSNRRDKAMQDTFNKLREMSK